MKTPSLSTSEPARSFRSSSPIHVLFVLTLGLLALATASAQTNYLSIHSFGFSDRTGVTPASPLIQGSDGKLYGTMTAGGTNRNGTVFRIEPDGGNYVELHSFAADQSEGREPNGRLFEATDGYLYGTAASGGNSNVGVIFRLNRNGGDYEVLRQFAGGQMDGAFPRSGVFEASDGVLYGTTRGGGSNNVGIVFKIQKSGAGFQILRHFPATGAGGRLPNADLIEGSDGALYGTFFAGGTSGVGGVYRIQKDGSGFTVLRSFAGVSGDGRDPTAGVIEASDGRLYGSTRAGGNNNQGTAFRINKDGTGYAIIRHFSLSAGDAQAPQHPFIEDSDGVLYNVTPGLNRAGASLYGTLFRLNKDGTGYQELRRFSRGSDGENPLGIVQGKDGALYGSAPHGGFRELGVLFRVERSGSNYTVIHQCSPGGGDGELPQGPLVKGSDDLFYGVTAGGGASGSGAVFRFNPQNRDYTVLRSFSVGDGRAPQGLIEGSDGALYGTTFEGGSAGFGTAFKLQKDGSDFQILWNFTLAAGQGHSPSAGVIEGSDGYLYGTTSSGGQTYGTVFRLARDGSSYNVLRVFADNSTDAKKPGTALLEGSDGALYGTTFSGGVHNQGAIFRLFKDGSQYGLLHSFSMLGGDGQWPTASLFEASDGALYGTTSSGGSNIFGTSAGVVFRLNKDGSAYQVVRHFTGREGDGSDPRAALVEAFDGALYGTTVRGGSNSAGTVYRLNKDGSGYATLHSHSNQGGDGREPRGGLVSGPDLSLYGVTTVGGSLNLGTIFKVLLPPKILIHPIGSEVTTGSPFTFQVLAEGTEPLSYQWMLNGTNLTGATSPTLTLSSVQPGDAGTYSVHVSNPAGSISSAGAVLIVLANNGQPVADASATLPAFISQNGVNGTAVLDGSRSYDPDGDRLHYAWSFGNPPQPLATGIVAIVTLPVGKNAIQLKVSDGISSDVDTVEVEIVTAADAISRLMTLVDSRVPNSQPLLATLRAAMASISRGQPATASNQLAAFQNQVSAQIAPGDPALAEALQQKAQEIIIALRSGSLTAAKGVAGATTHAGNGRAQFRKMTRKPDGKVRMEFFAESGTTHIIAASSDLADWQLIGVAQARAEGAFEFEDQSSAAHSARFYKIVTPHAEQSSEEH